MYFDPWSSPYGISYHRAKIMTLEEVIHLPLSSDVWVQEKRYDGFVYATTYTGHGSHLNFYHGPLPVKEYGENYVCWNMRPSSEDVRMVKWNDNTKELCGGNTNE